MDRDQAYHPLTLDKESRFITTFKTHMGLYRYTNAAIGFSTNTTTATWQEFLIWQMILFSYVSSHERNKALESCVAQLRDRSLTMHQHKCKCL